MRIVVRFLLMVCCALAPWRAGAEPASSPAPSPASSPWVRECGAWGVRCVIQRDYRFPAQHQFFDVVRFSFLPTDRDGQELYLFFLTVTPRNRAFTGNLDASLSIKPLIFVGCLTDCVWFGELSRVDLDNFLTTRQPSYAFLPRGDDVGTGYLFPREGLAQAIDDYDQYAIANGLSGLGDRVFFASGSAEISAVAGPTLLQVSAWFKRNAGKLARYPAVRMIVEGYADDPGSEDDNLKLSELRARAVRSFLVDRGVPMDRIKISAYGRQSLAVLGGGESAANQNRRVVFRIDR